MENRDKLFLKEQADMPAYEAPMLTSLNADTTAGGFLTESPETTSGTVS